MSRRSEIQEELVCGPVDQKAVIQIFSVNIALRLNRTLIYDPKTESFPNDVQANTFIAREQRKGYEIHV